MMMARPERPVVPDEGRPPERSVPFVADLHCGSPIHVLVIDDDRAMCSFLREALVGDGIHVDAVHKVEGFESQLRGKPYHLIILDYVIPGLASEQLFKWVQTYQPEAGIVVITGYPSVDSALTSLRARCYDYLTKPFSVTQLQETVRRYLLSRGLLRESEEAIRQTLGQAIREQRKARGLTLAQLADRASVSLGYLSQIELGKNSASIDTLYRISLALGTRMADLFGVVQSPGPGR